jgi:hypothetical protein
LAEPGRCEELPCRGCGKGGGRHIVGVAWELVLSLDRVRSGADDVTDFCTDSRPLNEDPPVVNRPKVFPRQEGVENVERIANAFEAQVGASQ